MFDFITDNLFIIVPITIILILRMIGAKKKQDQSQSDEEDEPEYEEEPPVALGHWETEKKQYTPPKAPAIIKPVPLHETDFFSRRDLEEASAVSANSRIGAIPKRAEPETQAVTRTAGVMPKQAAHTSSGSFASSLEHLSPLKKVIVMTEILSPPKALRETHLD